MGAWGYGITEDDTALDAYDNYMDSFNASLSPKKIEVVVRKYHAEALSDLDDDGFSVELGIAKAQWECGHVTPAIVKRIRKFIDSEVGMALWEDAGPKAADKRRKELEKFLAKLQTTNPRPKKVRKPIYRQPAFPAGTCLAVRDEETGKYAAVLVLLSPIEEPRPGQDTYGVNHFAFLDYFEKKPPALDVFERRQWLYTPAQIKDPPAWVVRRGESQLFFYKRANKENLTVVGRIRPRPEEALWCSGIFNYEVPAGFAREVKKWRAVRDDPKVPRYYKNDDVWLERFGPDDEIFKRPDRTKYDLNPVKENF